MSINYQIRPLQAADAAEVLAIYEAGMATGMATFEQELPSWAVWDRKYLPQCRLAVQSSQQLAGWAALSAVSSRAVYRGVAEVSIYLSPAFWGRGLGKVLLQALVEESEQAGFWTLQAGIFTENSASLRLHQGVGFRIVGIRERIGQLRGQWKDNYLLERRSKIV